MQQEGEKIGRVSFFDWDCRVLEDSSAPAASVKNGAGSPQKIPLIFLSSRLPVDPDPQKIAKRLFYGVVGRGQP